MKICDYGCGQEAKYPFKNGKWCCENYWQSCPTNRKEASIKSKEAWEDPTSGLNSDLCREKQSKVKKGKNNPMYKKYHSEETKKRWSENRKGKASSEEARKKMSESSKLTIEQIQQRHKTFSAEEEMRYNPNKPEEKEIQIHCNNSNCSNSREKGGWFTPKKGDLKNRIYALDKSDGNDGSFLYCSQYCKDTCPCYNLRTDPLQLAEYQRYYRKVQKSTNLNIKYKSDKIPNMKLRGREYGYDLDHKFSIFDGFNNDIDPKVIGHWKNLEVIKISDNRIKSRNSSISLEEIQKVEEAL